MSESIFERNIQCLKEYRSELYQETLPAINAFLQSPASEICGRKYEMIGSDRSSMNLKITGEGTNVLYHIPDAQTEVRELYERAKVGTPQLIFFLGLGLGHALHQFCLSKTKYTYGLFVVENDPNIFVRALSLYDFTHSLKTRTDYWLIGKPLNAVKANLAGFMRVHNTVNRSLKVIAQPMALEFDRIYYESLMGYFGQARDQATIWSGNSVLDSLHGIQNQLANLERIAANPGIGSFFNKFEGKTCLSIAAGPGTNEAWDFIKSAQGRIPIICCDTLLKPMNDRGIVPDLVTALERDSVVADMLRGQKVDHKTSLVAPTILLPDSFECFKGRHLIYGVTTAYSLGLGIQHLINLYPGSSAGNLNLAIATYLGFSRIILIGHNLAFALNSHESHLRGTFDPSREVQKTDDEIAKKATGGKVPTADGQDEVYTIREYNLFREQIESLIAQYPNTKFINTTAKGAHIEGTQFIPLKTVEKDLKDYSFNFWNHFEPLIKVESEVDITQRLKLLAFKINNAMIEFESMTLATTEILKKFPEWKKEIADAEERGEALSLEQLNLILNEILGLKVAVTMRSTNAGPMIAGVMSPFFSTFERIINELPHTHTNNYELKKDVILKHEDLFRSWEKWMPQIQLEVKKAAERLKIYLPQSSSPLSQTSPKIRLNLDPR